MTWILTIVILVILLLCWLLFSPFLLELDTASACARFSWRGIGEARAWYDGKWWMEFRILFFHKKLKLSARKSKPTANTEKRKKTKTRIPFYKVVNCMKTFRVKEWKLAIDTGDYPLNAKLYPLNFLPGLQHHLEVNFTERNYFYIKIHNAPWRIIHAWLR
jgi:hypothetical protein